MKPRRVVCEEHGGEVKKEYKIFNTNSRTKRPFTEKEEFLKTKI
jgi:hypothetical protein